MKEQENVSEYIPRKLKYDARAIYSLNRDTK